MSDPLAGRRQELLERVIARGETIRRRRQVKVTAIAAGSAAVVVLIVATALAQRDLDPREVAPIASGEATASPTPAPTPTATVDAAAIETPTPPPTPDPVCTRSDFDVQLMPDSKTRRVGETFRFVATARNISNHDCPARTGLRYWMRGPKASTEIVYTWGIHGDYAAGEGPPPWSPGQVERSEFEWPTTTKQYKSEPLEPGDYEVTFQFAHFCSVRENAQTGDCAAIASTTVTLQPAPTPSPSPSPAPLT